MKEWRSLDNLLHKRPVGFLPTLSLPSLTSPALSPWPPLSFHGHQHAHTQTHHHTNAPMSRHTTHQRTEVKTKNVSLTQRSEKMNHSTPNSRLQGRRIYQNYHQAFEPLGIS